ncbi:uncharacterized protein LOC116603081 [Nematostella vectensis]|uniref:uncharacterized protein LOC116603081 n=1 Tax=Nematostella vectensis TaxID=45351 RepID=UPI0020777AD8|nr:uncharacterized protein LOC116603081 [Nematostella vectensis]
MASTSKSNRDCSRTPKYSILASNIVGVQLSPCSEYESTGDPASDSKPQQNLSGKDIFDSFIKENQTTLNTRLNETLSEIRFAGWIEPSTLLLKGPSDELDVLKEAWRRRFLRSPANFVIRETGNIGSIGMDLVPQAPFLPLTKALYEAIAALNENKLSSTQKDVFQYLAHTYQYVHVPKVHVVHDCLGILIKERRVYFTGNAYFAFADRGYESEDARDNSTVKTDKNEGEGPTVDNTRKKNQEGKTKKRHGSKESENSADGRKKTSGRRSNGHKRHSSKESRSLDTSRDSAVICSESSTPTKDEKIAKSSVSSECSSSPHEAEESRKSKDRQSVFGHIASFIKGRKSSTSGASQSERESEREDGKDKVSKMSVVKEEESKKESEVKRINASENKDSDNVDFEFRRSRSFVAPNRKRPEFSRSNSFTATSNKPLSSTSTSRMNGESSPMFVTRSFKTESVRTSSDHPSLLRSSVEGPSSNKTSVEWPSSVRTSSERPLPVRTSAERPSLRTSAERPSLRTSAERTLPVRKSTDTSSSFRSSTERPFSFHADTERRESPWTSTERTLSLRTSSEFDRLSPEGYETPSMRPAESNFTRNLSLKRREMNGSKNSTCAVGIVRPLHTYTQSSGSESLSRASSVKENSRYSTPSIGTPKSDRKSNNNSSGFIRSYSMKDSKGDFTPIKVAKPQEREFIRNSPLQNLLTRNTGTTVALTAPGHSSIYTSTPLPSGSSYNSSTLHSGSQYTSRTFTSAGSKSSSRSTLQHRHSFHGTSNKRSSWRTEVRSRDDSDDVTSVPMTSVEGLRETGEACKSPICYDQSKLEDKIGQCRCSGNSCCHRYATSPDRTRNEGSTRDDRSSICTRSDDILLGEISSSASSADFRLVSRLKHIDNGSSPFAVAEGHVMLDSSLTFIGVI